MTFLAFETSATAGEPVEIFTVTFLAGGAVYRMTSDEDDVTVGGNTYTAVLGLERGEVEEEADSFQQEFEITIPATHALAQLFTGSAVPGSRVRVQAWRFHRADLPTPELAPLFDGYLETVIYVDDGHTATLIAQPEITAQGAEIPRRSYQRSCNAVLYEVGTCNVDDTDVAFRASALSVASEGGGTLVVSSGLSGIYADGFMTGGVVEAVGGTDYRLILDHVGNTLTLIRPFAISPSLVNVFAGCAHSWDVCNTKFANGINYQGFPFVPVDDIYQNGV